MPLHPNYILRSHIIIIIMFVDETWTPFSDYSCQKLFLDLNAVELQANAIYEEVKVLRESWT